MGYSAPEGKQFLTIPDAKLCICQRKALQSPMQSFATILANVCWKRHKKNLYNEDTFVSSRRYLCFRGGLLNKYHKILTCTPEDLRIGNPQHILFLGILCKGVAARRMGGKHLRVA